VIKLHYANDFQKHLKNKCLFQCHSFVEGRVHILDLTTLAVRPLDKWEFNAFVLLPLPYEIVNVVFAVRPKSKTPLQLAYSITAITEPTVIEDVGAAVKPLCAELYDTAFPSSNQIKGNGQLTFINQDCEVATDDFIFNVFKKFNAWSQANE